MGSTPLFSAYPEQDHLPLLHRLALAYLIWNDKYYFDKEQGQ